jgi:RimJ/RimL family protein N-acetyltransferase
VKLLEARDEHFAWLLGEAEAPEGLTQPPGGVDQPWVYRWLRRGLRERGGRGQWLMAAHGEVVGLCGHKGIPNEAGEVEIGYGVAPERRRLGYATRAVGFLIEAAGADPAVRVLTAQTALNNRPSQRALEANGFAAVGRSHDEDEGEMIVWRRDLR